MELITILGPTATGKTKVATNLALKINGEIISADSRQVFKGMDIGTGKDIEEYTIDSFKIPFHLIDIKKPTEDYDLFSFLNDYKKALIEISKKGNKPILCGGTTLYLSAVLQNYQLTHVPESFQLDEATKSLSLPDILRELETNMNVHNTTDTLSRERALKALRISRYERENPDHKLVLPETNHQVFGMELPFDQIKKRITIRLKKRLSEGMIDEAQELLDQGVSLERMKYFGLEYKFLAMFLNKEINYNDMFQKLNSAIHEFAKKQLTRYRKMEKEGVEINWMNAEWTLEDQLSFIHDKGVVFDC